jgi:hypothetical protein
LLPIGVGDSAQVMHTRQGPSNSVGGQVGSDKTYECWIIGLGSMGAAMVGLVRMAGNQAEVEPSPLGFTKQEETAFNVLGKFIGI